MCDAERQSQECHGKFCGTEMLNEIASGERSSVQDCRILRALLEP
jgi:hypothetical protein